MCAGASSAGSIGDAISSKDGIQGAMQDAYNAQTGNYNTGKPQGSNQSSGSVNTGIDWANSDEEDYVDWGSDSAANKLGYDLTDQSKQTGAPRPQAGLSQKQIQELKERDSWLSRSILDAHKNKTAYSFVTNPKTGKVVGYTHKANMPSLIGGIANFVGDLFNLSPEGVSFSDTMEVYTGQSEFDPFNADNFNNTNEGGQDEKKTPLDPCPEGYVYNEETQSCVKVESEDTTAPTIGTKFEMNAMPDLTNYGLTGGEYNFFKQMPGIIQAKNGIPRGPHGEILGAGGPKDDLVGPFMLSSQEYVEPYERVLDEGNGNYDRGIRVLEKKRMAALRKYRDRVKSEERNKA